MQSHFRVRALEPPTLLDRLRRRDRMSNVLVEIENRLARASKLQEVTAQEVASIANAYGVDLPRRFGDALLSLYRRHLEHCLRDRSLSAEQVEELAHLKAVLGLDDAGAERIHDEAVGRVYAEAVARAVADRRFDPEERQALEQLREALRLSAPAAARIRADAARAQVERVVEAASVGERLSPDEEAELWTLARSLEVEVHYGERTRRKLERFRLYWQIENGELPSIETPMPLQRGERGYHAQVVDWLEPRPITRRVRSEERTLRIKLGTGSYWRMGDLGVQRAAGDAMQLGDSGKVFITSKRLLFQGAKEDRPVRLAAVRDFTAYRNGVELELNDAPNVFLEFHRDVDVFAMILGRAIRDVR